MCQIWARRGCLGDDGFSQPHDVGARGMHNARARVEAGEELQHRSCLRLRWNFKQPFHSFGGPCLVGLAACLLGRDCALVPMHIQRLSRRNAATVLISVALTRVDMQINLMSFVGGVRSWIPSTICIWKCGDLPENRFRGPSCDVFKSIAMLNWDGLRKFGFPVDGSRLACFPDFISGRVSMESKNTLHGHASRSTCKVVKSQPGLHLDHVG